MDGAGSSRGSRFEPWVVNPPTTLGAALGQIVEAVARRHGDKFMEHLDDLAPGVRSIAVLEYAIRMTYADGLQAVFETAIDDIGEELIRAAQYVGASAYVDLFRRLQDTLPAAARKDWELREGYIIDHGDALKPYDDDFYALEDSGDVLILHVVRYVETHPDEFADLPFPLP